MDDLMSACLWGDLDFVKQALVSDQWTDVNWTMMLDCAEMQGHADIVECIRSSGKVPLYHQLLCACESGDILTVHKCIDSIVNLKELPEEVDWVELMCLACHRGHPEIMKLIAETQNLEARFDNALLLAIMKGDLKKVQQRIDQGTMPDDWQNFCAAVKTGNEEVANLLIRTGCVPIRKHLPLIHDSFYRQEFKYLIQHMKDVNIEVLPGFTLLHFLSYYDYHELIHTLGRVGVDVNIKSDIGQTPLHIACQGDREEMKRELEEHQKIVIERTQISDKLIKQMPNWGQKFDRSYTVSFLIQNNADINAIDINAQTPLHIACCATLHDIHVSAYPKLLKLLLDSGAKINLLDGVGMSPIALACVHGNNMIIKTLLDMQCDVMQLNHLGQSALYHACQWNNFEAATLLLEHSPLLINQVDSDGVSPLSISSWHGQTKMVALLLENHADANLTDKEGQTALHKVALSGYVDTAKILLKFQVNIDVQDITGCTALHIASQTHLDISTMLLEAGCLVDVENNLGNTALQISALSTNVDIARILISYDADVDHKNNCGDTALALLVSSLNLEMIELIAENLGNFHTVDNMGRSLIHKVFTDPSHSKMLHKFLLTTKCVTVNSNKGQTTINVATGQDREQTFVVSGDEDSLRMSVESKKKLDTNILRSAFNVSVIEFLMSKKLNVNAVDINNQTPLHLAVQKEKILPVSYLLSNGANLEARDKFGYTPVMLAIQHPVIFNLFRDHIDFKELLDDDVSIMLHLAHWWDVSLDLLPSLKTLQCQDFSKLPQAVKANNVNIDVDQLLTYLRKDYEASSKFMPPILEKLQPLTYVNHPHVVKTISSFIQDIQYAIKFIEPLLEFEFVLSGSEREKTKVLATNEVDALCVMTNIKHTMFGVPSSPATPILKECVELVCKDENVKLLKEILDEKRRLSGSKLNQVFGRAVAKALANPDLWNRYKQLQRVTVQDITAGNRTITALIVRWHDSIYQLLDVSIDMVPAVAIPGPEDGGWLPSWCIPHPILKDMGCVAVPKWKSSAPITMGLVEFGISHWGAVFSQIPEAMRQGYRLAKVVREKAICPQIEKWPEVFASDFVSSYMLKQCIFKEYQMEIEEGSISNRSDLFWARRIYERMEEAFEAQRLESFFIPEYNLLHDDKYAQYRETAINYARLCKMMLTDESAELFRVAYMGVE